MQNDEGAEGEKLLAESDAKQKGISVVQGPEIRLSKGARRQESGALSYYVSGPRRLDMNGSRVKGDSKSMMTFSSTLSQCGLHEAHALYIR